MSSHETIRVLEVEVDAAVPSPETHVKTELGVEEGRGKALEPAEGAAQDRKTTSNTIPAGGVIVAYCACIFCSISFMDVLVTASLFLIPLMSIFTVSNEAAAPSVQNVAIPISLSLSHPQTSMPISIQACPQVS